jgi:hypothetical protein
MVVMLSDWGIIYNGGTSLDQGLVNWLCRVDQLQIQYGKIHISSKVKIFIWRALHGILTLKEILANRHIGNVGSCPICGLGAEDVLHLLFTCTKAQETWAELGISEEIEDALHSDRDGSAVLEHLLLKKDRSVPGFDHINLRELISVTCWYLWWLRR